VKQYKEVKDCYILGGVDDVIVALEDSMVTMNMVTLSR
jgi:dynein heavy chain